MATKIWGGIGVITITNNNAGLPAAGYTEVVLTPESTLELANEFGDTTRWDKLVRAGIRLRGTFSAWFETSTTAGQGFEPADIMTNWAAAANQEVADANFAVNLDASSTTAKLTFDAFLSNLNIRKSSTAYVRMDGTFQSSGAVTGTNAA